MNYEQRWAIILFHTIKNNSSFFLFKSSRQEAGTERLAEVRSRIRSWPTLSDLFLHSENEAGGPKRPFHQGNIGGFDLNIHQMELNIKVLFNSNKHDHLCSTTQHRLAQWEGVWLSRLPQQWYTIHTCWLLHFSTIDKKTGYLYI